MRRRTIFLDEIIQGRQVSKCKRISILSRSIVLPNLGVITGFDLPMTAERFNNAFTNTHWNNQNRLKFAEDWTRDTFTVFIVG
jgi:hypothetical protein